MPVEKREDERLRLSQKYLSAKNPDNIQGKLIPGTQHPINYYIITDKETYDNKLVYLMSIEKARFRNPVIPDCKLELKIEAIRSHGRVWKYKGEAFVDEKKMADAIWSATIVDKK